MLAQLFTVLSITLLAGRVAVYASPVPPPEMLAEIENSVTRGDDRECPLSSRITVIADPYSYSA